MTESSNMKASARLRILATWTLDLLLLLLTYFYYKSFQRNTVQAIDGIINRADDSSQLKSRIHRFTKFKVNESKYVQVAVSIFLHACEGTLAKEDL